MIETLNKVASMVSSANKTKMNTKKTILKDN